MKIKQILRFHLYLIGLIILFAGLLIGFYVYEQKKLEVIISADIQPNVVFIWLAICFSTIIVWLVICLHRTFIDSLNTLKYAVAYLRQHDRLPTVFDTQDPNIREILNSILGLHNDLTESRKTIEFEETKLFRHFREAQFGVAYFLSDRQNRYVNSVFIQYLNTILDTITFDPSILFDHEIFQPLSRFLRNHEKENNFEYRISAHGLSFRIHVSIFEDKSFEITIHKLSEKEIQEKELTDTIGNIAHELRTPVAGVRGYLETLVEFKNMPEERRMNFLQRALKQIIRLSDIIQDTGLLTKASSSPQYFTKESVNIYDMLTELVEINLKETLEQQGFTVTIDLDKTLTVEGNYVLLYNIFRNLMDNALKYAGKNIHITIHSYSDEHSHYFSFADNGKGVAEEHLEHIFERFYQINKGRSRDQGGSGLGLSIVKDAVAFHQGNIYAQNRYDGGLEFRFSLQKS
ncbi:hypothetical protein FACS189413_01270 [Bacteroidia bacterium]|nr:hypothetical protein FACS189413_01270 [Bacteroidia bacterium]